MSYASEQPEQLLTTGTTPGWVGEFDLADPVTARASAIYLQQKIAARVIVMLIEASPQQEYRSWSVNVERLADAFDWLPSSKRQSPTISPVVAVSEEYSFVGRVTDIDHNQRTLGLLMRESHGAEARGDEFPVRLPLDRVRPQDKHKLRVGVRVDWAIDQRPLGDGSFITRSTLSVATPRTFTAEERHRVDIRAGELTDVFKSDATTDQTS